MTLPTLTVVDDDIDLANLFKEVAEGAGYFVQVFHDGVDFQNSLGDTSQIIMLDLMMPGMDGIEVIRNLAEKKIEAGLILVSGYDKGVLHSAHELAQESQLNVIASLTKPLKINDLRELLIDYQNTHPSEKIPKSNQAAQLTEDDLEKAIENNELVLFYQPQINLESGHCIGAEALVRWQHPDLGLVFPDAFIPMAETSGLIGDLTSKVIQLATEQNAFWREKNLNLKIAVNVSAENITSLSLPDQLINLVNASRLEASSLDLEITETALMGELVTSLDILTRLRMKGFQLSIDDFGTGYSSLAQLHRVPFTELKIDQRFIMQMEQDHEARAIVETCIMLGHKLNMKVVAEGVETQGILDSLKELGCDIAQGYHIARPMPADNLLEWLEDRSR